MDGKQLLLNIRLNSNLVDTPTELWSRQRVLLCLTEILENIMQSANPGWRVGRRTVGPGARFLAALVPYVTGEKLALSTLVGKLRTMRETETEGVKLSGSYRGAQAVSAADATLMLIGHAAMRRGCVP
jgi:hypothetical protein